MDIVVISATSCRCVGVVMQIDTDHVAKLRAAIAVSDGQPHVDLDVAHLSSCMSRLSLWESGLLVQVLMRAATARKLSREQRVLLALFVHDRAEEVCHEE